MMPSSSAPFFLALRYLRPRRSFVSVITLISILGVMLGVGVLVVVMSVFKGWQIEFKKLLLGFEPHIVLMQQRQEEPSEGGDKPARTDWRQMQQRLQSAPGVLSATPIAEGYGAIRTGKKDPEGVELLGLRDGAENALLAKLERHRLEGTFDLNGDHIILTDRLAKKLDVKLGDTVSVLAGDTIRQMIRDLRAADEQADPEKAQAVREEIVIIPKDLTVTAILRADTAGERCYTPLFIAQELFNLEGDVSGIEVELADPDLADRTAIAWLDAPDWPAEWSPRTWTDIHGYTLQMVENQKSLLWFLLLFIILVAAFCVMNTTITVTMQKRREIGILTALGTRVGQVIAIFLNQAGIIALLGLVGGLAGGFTVLHFRNDLRQWIAEATGRDFFPQDIYFLSAIPAQVDALDLAAISGLAIVLCVLAAWIPAWVAARVDPAVALRE
ncbi:MAG: FtsX-like permease family protein [Prosthecobacter sp.]|nr:FtsX-like permease family protein [Prosthecobacter sp.]